MHVKYASGTPPCRYTILFSHGNAVDLGQMSSFYIGLSARLGCNIFSYDYSGYGASTGQATEKNIYADIEAAFKALRQRYLNSLALFFILLVILYFNHILYLSVY